MADNSSSETLQLGAKAPDFTLSPANGNSPIHLAKLLERGPVIVEFLRGTW